MVIDKAQDVVLQRLEKKADFSISQSKANTVLLEALNDSVGLLLERDRETYSDIKVLETKAVSASVLVSFIMTTVGAFAIKAYVKEKE